MKTLIASVFLCLGLLFTQTKLNAQSVYFCEDVTSDGYAINSSSTFNISSEGSYLYVLVKLPYQLYCNSVRFEITRNGNYDNTIYMDTESNWVMFWKKINFYKAGRYNFEVYDEYDIFLASATVNIQVNDYLF